MAKCKITTRGRAFKKSLKSLLKKFRALEKDFEEHKLEIEADFKTACNAFCVPMPNITDLQRRVWKYDIGSTDLKKHPRECFRLIGILDDPDKSEPEMAAVILYHKSDQGNITAKEIKKLYDGFAASGEEDAEEELSQEYNV